MTATLAVNAFAQTRAHRGQLDEFYCHVDRDMPANPPTEQSKWKIPSTLITS